MSDEVSTMGNIERWWITTDEIGSGFLAYDDVDTAQAALGKHDESERVVEVVPAATCRGAVEALEWIEQFTSDRGDARMMDPGQARALIHRRASLHHSEGQ